MPGNYIILNSPVHGIVYCANNNSVDTVHRLMVLILSQGSPSEQFSWKILLIWKRCLSADSLYRHGCNKVGSPGHLFQRYCGIMGHVESQSTNEAVACSLLRNISSSVCGIQINAYNVEEENTELCITTQRNKYDSRGCRHTCQCQQVQRL